MKRYNCIYLYIREREENHNVSKLFCKPSQLNNTKYEYKTKNYFCYYLHCITCQSWFPFLLQSCSCMKLHFSSGSRASYVGKEATSFIHPFPFQSFCYSPMSTLYSEYRSLERLMTGNYRGSLSTRFMLYVSRYALSNQK